MERTLFEVISSWQRREGARLFDRRVVYHLSYLFYPLYHQLSTTVGTFSALESVDIPPALWKPVVNRLDTNSNSPVLDCLAYLIEEVLTTALLLARAQRSNTIWITDIYLALTYLPLLSLLLGSPRYNGERYLISKDGKETIGLLLGDEALAAFYLFLYPFSLRIVALHPAYPQGAYSLQRDSNVEDSLSRYLVAGELWRRHCATVIVAWKEHATEERGGSTTITTSCRTKHYHVQYDGDAFYRAIAKVCSCFQIEIGRLFFPCSRGAHLR